MIALALKLSFPSLKIFEIRISLARVFSLDNIFGI